MRNLLVSSTAIVGIGILTAGTAEAAEGIKLGLGGFMNNFFAVGSVDESPAESRNFNETGLFSDGEIWFTGETTLDNGITFGANVQLESFTFPGGDQIDENFAYIEGNFGRFIAGSENSAAYLMQISAPNVGVPLNSGWITSFIAPPPGLSTTFRNPSLSTFVDYGNDENQITYFTPRFMGFQFGVSYAPTIVRTGEGKNFPVQADQNTEYNNGFSVGANFTESFNGVDIALSGGYRRAEAPDVADVGNGGANGAGFIPTDDLELISAGANIGYAGVTVGGSYAVRTDAGRHKGFSWDAGASYSTGPWSVGVTYFHSEITGSPVPGEDELDAVSGAVAYKIGPGITTSLSVLYAKWEEETPGNEQDGVVGVLGLKFNF